MAFQILNLSIDIDYIVYNTSNLSIPVGYDDIDSFSELIVEMIACDSNYTSENDDDSGHPQDKGIEKYSIGVSYVEQFKVVELSYSILDNNSSWTNGLDLSNKTCKGYYKIICPPPEV
jgi:hypothetical protein